MSVSSTSFIDTLACRLGMAALALLAIVPFLQPWHTTPIPSFYSEWWALAVGLTACLGLIGARSFPLPGAVLIAMALAAVVWLQVVSGRAEIPQLASLYGLYLVWAALLASTSRLLADRYGLPALFHVLAMAVLTGAVLAALLGLMHPWLHLLGWPGFPLRHGGPVGQANHLTSYLWLGLASCLYLHAAGRLPRLAFWLVAALLTLTVALVGQRSSFLYAAAQIGVAFLAARNGVQGGAVDARRMALGIGVLFVFMQPIVWVLPSLDSSDAAPPPALRVVQQVAGPSIRLQLLRVGLVGIIADPLLGSGVGSYPGLALTHADTISAGENPGPAESAHNILIDIAVEFGVPTALLVLCAALVWLWRLRRHEGSADRNWAASVFVILGLHALIEYPLSHAYFLGLLAVVAGAYGSSRQVGQRLAPVALSLGLVIWGGIALAEIKRDYRLLEFALVAGKQPSSLARAQTALLRIPAGSLLSPWVATTACVSLDPLNVDLKDGLAVCRLAMSFAPSVESGVNAAVLQWQVGNSRDASDLLRRLRTATSYAPGGVERRLDGLVLRDERLKTLQ